MLLGATAVALSVAQVLDVTALAGVEASRGAVVGPALASGLAWLWPAWFAIPLLIRRQTAFRIVCMIFGACPVLVVGVMTVLTGRSGIVLGPDVLFVIMYEVPGFPGAMVLLLLAALASYGSRREAEKATLLGLLLVTVTVVVIVLQALLLSAAALAG